MQTIIACQCALNIGYLSPACLVVLQGCYMDITFIFMVLPWLKLISCTRQDINKRSSDSALTYIHKARVKIIGSISYYLYQRINDCFRCYYWCFNGCDFILQVPITPICGVSCTPRLFWVFMTNSCLDIRMQIYQNHSKFNKVRTHV